MQNMFSHMDRFGADHKQLLIKDHFAIGYQSMWTVPEEQGEQQPLVDEHGNHYLVFYGRIDNRQTLAQELGISLKAGSGGGQLSDARLLFLYLQRFSDSRLDTVIGPFVFVYYQAEQGRVIAARDAMGARYLSFYCDAQKLIIASYDLSVAAHPEISYVLNDEKRIRLLCNIMEPIPQSTLVGVEPLLPGHQLEFKDDALSHRQYYLPDPKKRIRLENNQAYALEMRRLLDQAVQRRLRSLKPVASMLSGGMDSVPITISASIARADAGHVFSAFSWVFDRHSESDERSYSSKVCDDFSVKQTMVNCDEVWPQFNSSAYLNPVLPYISPYNEFNRELFKQAQEQGVGTLLSGIGGDMLYSGSGQLILELLVEGRVSDSWREAKNLFRLLGDWRKFCKNHLIAPLPGIRAYLERKRDKSAAEYLSEQSQRKLKYSPHWLHAHSKHALRPQQYRNVIDAFEGEDANFGKYLEADYGLERRYPLRDRELVEFMLAIPSDQLFSMGNQRPIIKRAYMHEFDPSLNQRNNKTNFYPVIQSGIASDVAMDKWLAVSGAIWRQDVKQDCFIEENSQNLTIDAVKWRCAYHEFWRTVCYNSVAFELGELE